MAYQLSTIITKVQQRIRDTSYDTGQITNFINDTQNDIFNEYRLVFMETSQNYTTAIGVEDISNGTGLPTNFAQAQTLILTTTGKEKTIEYRDIHELEEEYADIADTTLNPNGTPLYWYKAGNTINLFPAPDQPYTVTLRYDKKATILVNDTDVPDIPSEFEEILVTGAVYRVLQVKDNYDQAGVFQNKYDEILQKLVLRYTVNQTGRPTILRINRPAVRRYSSMTPWRY